MGRHVCEPLLAAVAILACGAALGLPIRRVLVVAASVAVLHLVGLAHRIGIRYGALPLAVVAATAVGRYTTVDWKPALAIFVAIGFLTSEAASSGAVSATIRRMLEPPDALSIVVAVSATCAGAVIYQHLRPEAEGLIVFGPRFGLPTILVLAVLNSVAEEGCWRGLLWDLAERCHVGVSARLIVTSLSFGLAHVVAGVPSGAIGLVETTALGLAAGFLRWRTGTLVLPVAVHAVLDVAVLTDLSAGQV